MNAAIIELNALADPDWARSDDQGPRDVITRGLVLGLVSRVKVRSNCLELCRAGVNHFIDRAEPPLMARLSDLLRKRIGECTNVNVREAEALRGGEQGGRELLREQSLLHRDDPTHPTDKPGVDPAPAADLDRGDITPQRRHHRP